MVEIIPKNKNQILNFVALLTQCAHGIQGLIRPWELPVNNDKFPSWPLGSWDKYHTLGHGPLGMLFFP